jgi:hypothetical protein
MATIKSLEDAKEKISPDIVYQEMYQEMRRYRDYELISSQWYTGFLVVILGALIAGKQFNPIILISIKVISLILTFGWIFSVIYVKDRNKELRNWVTKWYEPTWKDFKPEEKDIKPWQLIIVSQSALCIAIVLIAKIQLFSQLIFPSPCGAGWYLP